MFGGMNWAPNLDTPENKKFVAAYEQAYGSVPGSYAMQAYDTALLIDSAVKAAGGKTPTRMRSAAALKKADFKSLRGDFKFGTNGFPIQDFYLVKAAKRPDGKFQTEIVEKVFDDYADAYAKECAATNCAGLILPVGPGNAAEQRRGHRRQRWPCRAPGALGIRPGTGNAVRPHGPGLPAPPE